MTTDKRKASCRKLGHELRDQWHAGQVIGLQCARCEEHVDKPREWCKRRTMFWKAKRLAAVEYALSRAEQQP